MYKYIFKPITWLFISFIKMYKCVISPLLPNCCRFTPSCSTYSIEVLRKHGLMKGMVLTISRILRCHPGTPGGYDPVP